MPYQDLLFEKRDNIATITLNRPQSFNAITQDMLNDFAEVCRVLTEDNDIRVAIFTGAGKGFCSGIDLKMTDLTQRKEQLPNMNNAEQWIARVQAITKPTIAAVNGVAAGGGLGLALGCDIRIASETARFGAIFAKIGMPVLDGVGSLLPRTVGLAKALEMIYTADVIDAGEAERIGLVSYVVPAEKLMERTLEMARKIAGNAPVALQLSKNSVYSSLHRSYQDYLTYQFYNAMINSNFASHDVREGGLAFREKRQAKFRGLTPSEQG